MAYNGDNCFNVGTIFSKYANVQTQEVPKNLWGVGKMQFLYIFKGPLASPTLRGSSYASSPTPTRS